MRPARWFAALALLALPLAGCTAPAPASPPAAALDAGGASPSAAAALGPALEVALPATEALVDAAPVPEDLLACSVQPQRRESAEGPNVVVTVVGCLAASEPILIGSVPSGVDVGFDVGPGARELRVLLHLHGAEALAGTLLDPWHRWDGATYRQQADGTGTQDSQIEWVLAAPREGEWTLRGGLQEHAVGKRWTATVTVAY